MVGSVLAHELLLGSRRHRLQIFRYVYAGWLLIQLVAYYWLYLVDARVVGNFWGAPPNPEATAGFAGPFVSRLVTQQFVLLFLMTPALVAGAITDEKTRGTLQYLLAADLLSWEIVVGK